MIPRPSGEQFEIAHDTLRATIVEVGGGLRTLTAGDRHLLDGFPEDEMCHDGRGQLLIPWPNRLAGGQYTFADQKQQLPLTEVSHGNAIHGLVRWVEWAVTKQTRESVTMSHRLHPMPGYPFMLDLAATYTLTRDGLQVVMSAENIGTVPCPFGAGQHPYVSAGTVLIDESLLRVPASTVHRYDDRLIPVERIPVAGTSLDFRDLRPIGDTVINMDYTDFERDADGRARIALQAPEGGPTIEVWMDEAFKHATIYTGETVQPPSHRRRSLAVEPMTCPPNAFISGQDLLVLSPGDTWRGTWGITITLIGN